MSMTCSQCGKKVAGWGETGLVCVKCGYVYCGKCAGASLFSNGKCPRCGGKTVPPDKAGRI